MCEYSEDCESSQAGSLRHFDSAPNSSENTWSEWQEKERERESIMHAIWKNKSLWENDSLSEKKQIKPRKRKDNNTRHKSKQTEVK